MTAEKAKEFYENFTPPKGFTVPEVFPIMRHKSILIKHLDRSHAMLKSGIYIPDTNKAIKPQGRIYACGPDVTDLKPGMLVIYNMFANQVIYFDGIEYLHMSEIDVYTILPEDVIMLEKHIDKEPRMDVPLDDLPSIEPSKEEKEYQKDQDDQFIDAVKEAQKKKNYPVN